MAEEKSKNIEFVRTKIFELLNKKGLQQKQLADFLNIDEAVISQWKSKRSSSFMSRISEIATFLNVPIDIITGINPQENPASDKEVREYLEELKSRSEMRTLFKISKGATKEDIEKTIDIIKALKK